MPRPSTGRKTLEGRGFVPADHVCEQFGKRYRRVVLVERTQDLRTQRDDLIAWYERRGYRRTGKMSPFPYGDERFGIPKRPDLEFELLVKTLV